MEKEKNTQQNAISDLMNDLKLSRRSFVKATAATGAALALGTGLTPDLRALAQAGKAAGGDIGQWIASTCQGCTSWCSKEVYVVRRLHRDADEADFSWPVLSISLGDPALFRIGGTARSDPTRSMLLESGDVLLLE